MKKRYLSFLKILMLISLMVLIISSTSESMAANTEKSGVSRAKFANELVNALGWQQERAGLTEDLPFYKDVPQGYWAKQAIHLLTAKGLFRGHNGNFYPNRTITRLEAVTVIIRALENQIAPKYILGEDLPFLDKNTIPEWGAKYVYTAYRYGVMAGYPDGTFRSSNSLQENEIKYLVERLISLQEKLKNNPDFELNGITILTYHHLAPRGSGWDDNPMVITPEQFEEQLKFLSKNGYETVFLKDLAKYLSSNEPLPPKVVAITFDDGYESNYVYSFPLLKKYGMKATISLVVKEMQEVPLLVFDSKGKTKLAWPQLKEMVDSGLVEIQSHTYDSHRYVFLDKKQQNKGYALTQRAYLPDKGRQETISEQYRRIYEDLKTAKVIIEKRLGQECYALTYPYGVFNANTQKAAQELGYKVILTSLTGLNYKPSSSQLLRRITVYPHEPLEIFVSKLSYY